MTTKAAPKRTQHNYFSMDVLANMDTFVRNARKVLQDAPEFDTFVVRGMSGAIAGGILARSLKKNLYVVRKENDGSHDSNKTFGLMGQRWLFLDDFVSSGSTFWATWDGLRADLSFRWEWDSRNVDMVRVEQEMPVFAGAFLYGRHWVGDAARFKQYLLMNTCWSDEARARVESTL